jgi:hypothetical protein
MEAALSGVRPTLAGYPRVKGVFINAFSFRGLGSSPGRKLNAAQRIGGIVGDFTEVVRIVDDFSIRSGKRCHANVRAA